MTEETKPTLFFRDRYFDLDYSSRLLVKTASFFIYGTIFVLATYFFFFGDRRFFSVAILFGFFLIDRILQVSSGERQIDSRVIQAWKENHSINVAPYLTGSARSFLDQVLREEEVQGREQATVFLLLSLTKTQEVNTGLSRLGIPPREFLESLRQRLRGLGPDHRNTHPHLISQLPTLAFEEAVNFGEIAVSPASLFLGVLKIESEHLSEVFAKFNFSREDFVNAIIFGRLARGLGKKIERQIAAAEGSRKTPHRVMNRAWTARPTEYLDSVSEDLTALAGAGLIGFLVGHEKEYQALLNILSREAKNNALLLGLEGVGKETIVEHLAYEIMRDEVPPKLFDKRLVRVHISSVTSGAKTPGEIQERFEKLINEALLAGNVVLYFPDIHNLKLTTEGGLNAFEALKPIFSSSVIPTIGTSTQQDFRNIIERDQSFLGLFDTIRVEELSEEETVRFLTYQSYLLESKWKTLISYPAIKQAAKLAKRFLREKPLPSSALDLLQEALADAKNKNLKTLAAKDVSDLVSRKVKVPVEIAGGQEAEVLLDLENRIHTRLINQEAAVKSVAAAMRQYRAGLSREKGPIAAFLFVGPTGVGKTELSKTLAEIYFGGEEEMIRFDMGEYQDPKSVWNFIGSPDGQIPGNLTEAVKRKPFAVLLFDEFEKAHPDVLELFLPLFDEGRLSDSLGNVMDFTNTIMISTSNAHSNLIKEEIEKGTAVPEIAALLKKRLTEYFKPELLNRFDEVIVFRSLTEEEIQKIAVLQIQKIAKRLENEQGIKVNFAPEVPGFLARLGWDPVFGARPLRGVIREKITEVLAEKILRQEVKRGSKVEFFLEGEEIQIRI